MAAIDWTFVYIAFVVSSIVLIMLITWLRAAVLLGVEWVCTFVGLLIGHVVVGFVLGYRRAWEINRVPLPRAFEEDEDE